MKIADCGTTWTKIYDDADGFRVERTDGVLRRKNGSFDASTGHFGRSLGRLYKNELTALARGGEILIPDDDFVLVDVGARDAKLCRFNSRKVSRLDWNQSCGALVGFTTELLCGHFSVQPEELPETDGMVNVTCGVFGLEKIFDSVASGASPDEAIAMFIRGVAYNTYKFADKPDKIYLSGGMCENPCFIKSLREYCDVIPIGRNVLLEGLRYFMENEDAAT